MRRSLVALLALASLALPSSAAARVVTETAGAGQVTATFSYDQRTTRSEGVEYRDLQVTIDRAGVRLVDKTIEADCPGCPVWPAAAGSDGTQSITVRDLDGDGEPEVLVDLFTGGVNCCWYSDSWRFDAARGVYVEKVLRAGGGSFPYVLRDLNRDAVPEFRSYDQRFAYRYGSNADTPRPLRIFQWDAGRLVDVTLGFPRLAGREAASLYRAFLRNRKRRDVNVRGIMAAYLADSYNAGRGRIAWRRMVAAYRRGDFRRKFAGEAGPHGRRYLRSLRSFLRRTGYLRRR